MKPIETIWDIANKFVNDSKYVKISAFDKEGLNVKSPRYL